MKYDALVIGAGPAGSTAALLLARAGWSVAIVEKASFPRRKVCGEFMSAPALALLARLGVAEHVLSAAGPDVRELAVYAGRRMVVGAMPRAEGPLPYGRALGRERLDTILLAAARAAGAVVYQPVRVERFAASGPAYVCTTDAGDLRAPIVIAAHGSWDTGGLAPAHLRAHTRPSDLLAFKARFARAALPPGRMPLVAFPGGYGGLVESDDGHVSFSCCVSRDVLSALRKHAPGVNAGAAVLAHVRRSCRGANEAFNGATVDVQWLAVGPIRPGLRRVCGDGYFAVGNAMGEAHPIVAEGISMAIQSAWLLCARLVRARRDGADMNAVARDYARAYRASFAPRIYAASAFAALAMRPAPAAAAAALLAALPGLLAFGARCAGKARIASAPVWRDVISGP